MSPLLAAPILLTITLVVSGLAKLPEREGTVDAMTSLRMPWPRLHPLAAVVVPVAELVGAAALWVPWVPLQVAAAAAIALLMAAYLVIIARALSFGEAVHCSCFGTLASPTVSRATLYRNLTLTALAALGVLAAATGAIARAEREAPLALLGWALAVVVAMALTSFALGGVTGAAAPAAEQAGAEVVSADGEEDYVRRPIPYAVLERMDGSTVLLRELAAERAAIVIVLSQGCGPCARILPQVAQWSQRLAPLVAVRVAFMQQGELLTAQTLEQAGEEPLHDLDGNLQRAIGMIGSPTAVLLGADGHLAGGPVIGSGAVEEFISDVIEQIDEAREAGELPAVEEPDPADGPSAGEPATVEAAGEPIAPGAAFHADADGASTPGLTRD